MVEMHRSVLSAAGPGPAVLLDSSYGFQENADTITEKAQTYFRENVGRPVTPVQWRGRLDGARLDEVLTAIRTARSVYAGPGSPSYAMRVWGDSGFAEAMAKVIAAGGTGTFSSAAAIALGTVAMPTHEIYRGGADPHWLPGTDLLGLLTGISAAIIPHYDLAPKKGSHDMSCCYIGERRMRQLERQLPPDTHLIGIDEHTALILELGSGTARVVGRGGVTVRVDGQADVIPAGTEVPLSDLNPKRPRVAKEATEVTEAIESIEATEATKPAPGRGSDLSADHSVGPSAQPVGVAADSAYAEFEAALVERDADTAASVMLDVERILSDSLADGTDPVAVAHARRILRGMMLELAGAASDGLADPSEKVAPLVSAVLEQRSAARQRRDYATADHLRDQLSNAGIEVRDSSRGAEWSLQETSRS
jgi:cyanophycinase-like exopeptidase